LGKELKKMANRFRAGAAALSFVFLGAAGCGQKTEDVGVEIERALAREILTCSVMFGIANQTGLSTPVEKPVILEAALMTTARRTLSEEHGRIVINQAFKKLDDVEKTYGTAAAKAWVQAEIMGCVGYYKDLPALNQK
jgi:hypothetical protein